MDLIERLEEAWRLLYGDGDEHDVCNTIAEAQATLRAVREAPVVCIGKSAVRGVGWQMFDTDGDSIQSLPFEDGSRVRLVPEGEARHMLGVYTPCS